LSLLDIAQKRRTKIICTIGPATSSEQALGKLIRAGMDCARLNFSHGAPADHLKVIKTIRKISCQSGRQVAILQDLPGPKFRVGNLPLGSVVLKKGDVVALTSNKHAKQGQIPMRSSELAHFAPIGGLIFLSDGSIKLRILSTTNAEIRCKCEIGGTLLSGKGINVPELKRGFQTFTKRDREFLSFGLEHGVDLVAVSFVRKASDVESVRNFTRKKRKSIPIVSKIEKKEAVENIEGIVRSSDALMVARGDLGVENPLEQVPELQKKIITQCTESGVPVITATQMLESMVNSPSPTRAEVTDVANAIFDGTDAVMLSEETAVGKYPFECVSMLNKVSLNAEARMRSTKQFGTFDYSKLRDDTVNEAMGKAAAAISIGLGANGIVTYLDSIEDVSKISRHRPSAPIVAISDSDVSLRRLNIVWGVYPLRVATASDRDKTSAMIVNLTKEKFLRAGERSILVCLDRLPSQHPTIRMQVTET
jgi:pyruvate kinase